MTPADEKWVETPLNLSAKDLRRIATYAAVSKVKVADYLSGYAPLPPRSAREVDSAVVDLALPDLRGRPQRKLVVIVPEISNMYFGQMCDAIQLAAADVGWSTFIALSQGDCSREVGLLTEFSRNEEFGPILLFSNNSSKPELWNLVNKRQDIVLVGERFRGCNCPTVLADFQAVGSIAAQEFLAKEYQAFAFVGGPYGTSSSTEISAAFRNGLRQGFGPRIKYVQMFGCHSFHHGNDAAERLARKGWESAAVLAGSTKIARGLINRIEELGLSDAFSIIAYDRHPLTAEMALGFPTIASARNDLAQACLDLARQLPRGGLVKKLSVTLRPALT